MDKLLKFLLKNNKTISTAESFTGGMFANLITNLDNSSKVFKGSFVCYSEEFKENFLNVSTIKKYGVVSEQTAFEMAKNTLDKLKTDIVISFTGYAPVNKKINNEGISYICIYNNNEFITYKFIDTTKNRKIYKKKAIKFAISKLF